MDQVIFRTAFCANLEHPFKSHKPVSNYRPTNDIFDLSISFWQFILHLQTIVDGAEIPFLRGKSALIYLKINRSVKTPWNRPTCPRMDFAQKAKSLGEILLARAYILESTYRWNTQSVFRQKISICLIRGRMELLGNDDVSVVYALNRLG